LISLMMILASCISTGMELPFHLIFTTGRDLTNELL
jgi:hypothetical protein